jgi:hypothetical protein
MRNTLLTLTLFSGLALGATGVSAETPFPLSAGPDAYAAPIVGVELAGLMLEGRSAFSPAPAEGLFGFADFALPLDYTMPPSEQ